jgi:two-component sensor histidine kinase/Tfp pilus assembly protein PilF
MKIQIPSRRTVLFLQFAFTLLITSNSVLAQPNITKIDSILSLPLDSTLSWMHKSYGADKHIFLSVSSKIKPRIYKTQNNELIGDYHSAVAAWHGYNGIYSRDTTIRESELAVSYYLKTKNLAKIATSRRQLAFDYMNKRRLAEAEIELFKAIAIFEEIEDKEGLASSYRTLANSYLITEEPKKAIKYLDLAAPIFKQIKNYNSLSYSYLGYTNAYSMAKDYYKALEAGDECLRIVKEFVPDEVFVEVRAHNFKGDAFIGLEKYQEALKAYQKAYDLCVIQIGEERSATWLTQVGLAYLKLGQNQLAIENLLKGIKGYENKNVEANIIDYESIAEAYQKIGDFKNAFIYTNKAYESSKRTQKEKITSLENEGIVKYESGKKDQAIAEQQLLIDQKNKTQSIAMASTGILALLLIGLFYSFRKNKEKTKLITAKNQENELLLKEIHHRVKNNLEMVKSLIALQSAELEDSVTKDAMIASQNRVQSMGIIHQKLYQGTNLGSIEMKDYFVNLSEGILDSFNAEEKVKIECVMEDLELDVDTAVPIGLIVNELLTNTLKYAFPEETQGEIKISMSQEKGKVIRLNVADNGIGKVIGLKPKGTGFGTRLVQLLTQQLNGVMEEKSEEGTVVSFTFKLDQAA